MLSSCKPLSTQIIISIGYDTFSLSSVRYCKIANTSHPLKLSHSFSVFIKTKIGKIAEIAWCARIWWRNMLNVWRSTLTIQWARVFCLSFVVLIEKEFSYWFAICVWHKNDKWVHNMNAISRWATNFFHQPRNERINERFCLLNPIEVWFIGFIHGQKTHYYFDAIQETLN